MKERKRFDIYIFTTCHFDVSIYYIVSILASGGRRETQSLPTSHSEMEQNAN
jgi:hypothetical protein